MSWIVPVGIGLVLWGASFLYLRALVRRRTDPGRMLADYTEEAERIVATIDAATDRDARLVEERIKTLRALLEDADRRLATLSREADRRLREDLSREQLARSPSPAAPGQPVSRSAAESPSLPAPAGQPVQAPAAKSSEAAAALSSSAESPTARPSNELPFEQAPGAPESSDVRFSLPSIRKSARPIQPAPPTFPEQVSALYRKGMSVDLIAQTLNAAQAEVEFAVALVENAWKGEESP